ncbi:aggregation-promoting factor C-terminal-like domain-containing protein [Agromyces sp. NPDC004153]
MRIGGKAVAGIAVVLAVLALPAVPAVAEDYPTWDEVQAAKADVTTREAEATRITAFVDELEAEAGRLGDAAVVAAAASAAAESARAAAETRATTLRTQADAAAAEAEASAARLGRVSAVLARSGGADVGLRLFFDDGSASDLLMGLSRAAQLADLYGGVAAQAKTTRADAAALSEQADVAESERTRLAAEAEAAAAEAEAAHEAAEARVVEQQGVLDTLYAQLASLRDRTVELERQYRIGEQVAQEQAARAAAAAAAAAAGASSGGSTGPPPPGVVVDRAAAKAYAASRMAAYGWGSDQFRCLDLLWTRESVWRANAYNASSGAYGIPQSLPGSKMASAGADWRTNAATQINWGLGYIDARYGSPCAAWAHSEAVNWY